MFYYPLHVHTAIGSLGDSILKIDDYIKKAKEIGLNTLAITDHGTLTAMYEFYTKCLKENIKPIIGCEVYLCDNQKDLTNEYYHLLLIAYNNTGLKNLLTIVNDANLNGFYKKPRTDISIINKYREGLICTSACIAGPIAKSLLEIREIENIEEQEQTYNKLKKNISILKNIFDNNFYLEIQPCRFEEQIYINKCLIKLSKETNCPLIVTNDIHYLNKEDSIIHNAHICIHRKKELTNELLYKDDVFYLMTELELKQYMNYLPKDILDTAINNTKLIADKCYIEIENTGIDMPKIELPDGYKEDEYLLHLALESMIRKIYKKNNPLVYMERLIYEYEILKQLGFCGYFLTIKDIVDYAKNNNIPVGPGRGSATGSLIAYLIGLTKVDPIKHNLLFERFISVERKEIPDYLFF